MTHQDQMDLAGSVPNAVSDKDLPLLDDIRLLGRLLGDCVREQEGENIFDIIENIRQTSIRFYRDDDGSAKRELENFLNALDPETMRQLGERFAEAEQRADVRGIEIAGAGKAFVAGADVKYFVDNMRADRVADVVSFAADGQRLFRHC